MKEVFVVADNVVSPIGKTATENFEQLKKGVSGIEQHNNNFSEQPVYVSLFKENVFVKENKYTRFEQLVIASVEDALSQTDLDVINNNKTIFILSSTKGNISLLETETFDEALKEKISLPHSAKIVADHFKLANKPLIVSHACISGVLALTTAMRLLNAGLYENAIVTGADIITKFIFSGFASFQAISNEPCRPFDAERKGVTLGEAAGTIILSTNKAYSKTGIQLCGGSVSNDANHISGPSRTGEELYSAITHSLAEANMKAEEIGFISAHGTATVYNDEMEAKAFDLAGMNEIPTNSLKGYYGHTLGAAGIIESVMSLHSLNENIILPTKGFLNLGVSKNLHICSTLEKGNYSSFLKTASGFGGCNAAVVFRKS
ncbi:beta-ketoacyl synthase [Panacibacter ginsenosidivorans]|uniref:Beta-ketoacyl synthase n=1 Tax=Panacibacter ginsenosidivorans TaxID=1813871 RepID=A0A5B8VEJ9_9BACT|nr:beta-ketoacyl synthase N-terminal-like domain-containing protein [Panacibacter ginsenosidivorans]QEC69463.1 beta-ketoacyl synthase [Panacibacter ginsenosidivorans]